MTTRDGRQYETATSLRAIVERHRPKDVRLLDIMDERSLTLQDRYTLNLAVMCELFQQGYELNSDSDERHAVWRLATCVQRECTLYRGSIDLIKRIVAKSDQPSISGTDIWATESWTGAQRDRIAQILRRYYIASRLDGIQSGQRFSQYGVWLWDLRRLIWTSKPLQQEDLSVLRETVTRWDIDLVPLLDTLARVPLQDQERTRLYNALTIEIQETGLSEGYNERGKRLDLLIEYIGWLPTLNRSDAIAGHETV